MPAAPHTGRVAVDLGTYGEAPAALPKPAPPVAPRSQRSRRRTRRTLLVGALAALLAADLGLLVGHARVQDSGPVAAAGSLLAALGRGDGADAARLVVPPAGPSRLTAADARAQRGRLAAVRALDRSGDTATVQVAFDSAGVGRSGHSLVLTLRRSGGGLLSAPRWWVVAGLPVLHLATAGYETGAVVDGRPLPLTGGRADVTVFPGQVPVGLTVAPPAGAVSTQVDALTSAPAVVLQPGLDAQTEDELSHVVARRLIPGGEAVEGPNAVHPSHVDIDHASIGADGRTLRFDGVLDMLVRAQTAYDTPTLSLSGTATYADGTLTLTSLQASPISSGRPSPVPAP